MLEQSLSNTQIFSKRDIIAFSHVETLDSISVLSLGAILNIEITNQKHKNVKNVTPNIQQKGFYSIRTKARNQ